MKAIIDNKLYDTDDSEVIYVDNQGRNPRFYYQTPKGNFFVLYSNNEIFAKSEQDIKDLLGKVDVDKYIELFGEPEEG